MPAWHPSMPGRRLSTHSSFAMPFVSAARHVLLREQQGADDEKSQGDQPRSCDLLPHWSRATGPRQRRRRPRIESRNDEKKIWMPTMTSVAARIASRSSRELAEAALDPAARR